MSTGRTKRWIVSALVALAATLGGLAVAGAQDSGGPSSEGAGRACAGEATIPADAGKPQKPMICEDTQAELEETLRKGK